MDTPAEEPRGPRGPSTTPPHGDPLKRESDRGSATPSKQESERKEGHADRSPESEEEVPPGTEDSRPPDDDVRDLPR